MSPDPARTALRPASSRLFVGAYAASPALAHWDPAVEREYLSRVLEVDGVRGLELPWPGLPGAYDFAWQVQASPDAADLVITDIGHTLHAVSGDERYGLASDDDEGRRRAVADAARLRDDVERAVDAHGRRCVTAVELHSAPRADHGSAAALRASLGEIATWDWLGAQVLVEHCDTLVPSHRPEKGYLPLDDELGAIDGYAGLAMNWGRCAIELHDPDAVAAQIAHAAASGLLRGLVFSGVSDRASERGPAWQDNHPSFAPDEPGGPGVAGSLLTARRAADALACAGDVDWVAVKMGFHPLTAPIADKVAMIAHAVATVHAAAVAQPQAALTADPVG